MADSKDEGQQHDQQHGCNECVKHADQRGVDALTKARTFEDEAGRGNRAVRRGHE